MRLFYSIGIFFYGIAVRVATLWNTQAKLLAEGWRHSYDRLHTLAGKKVAWFHAASLGEFEQARPVLEAFRRQHPEYAICLTFFSPSGYEVRKHYEQADVVAYLPLDTPNHARRWVQTLQPEVTFFVKYEFWYNLLINLKQHGIPTYIFSAIFRPQQYFFRPVVGRWFRKQLLCYSHLFVQNEESLALLQSFGIKEASVAGDTRFDRVRDIASSAPARPEIETFVGNMPVILAGSTWEPDETHLQHYLQQHPDKVKMILAPHMVDENHLQQIEKLFDGCTTRYSVLKKHLDTECQSLSSPATQAVLNKAVLIIDNIGMLSSLYRYATIAYIGGGFGKGIHNILEAITFGKPVLFGPRYHKFKEAVDIIATGGGNSYSNDQELSQQLQTWLQNDDAYRNAADNCNRYLQQNLGATQTILNKIDL